MLCTVLSEYKYSVRRMVPMLGYPPSLWAIGHTLVKECMNTTFHANTIHMYSAVLTEALMIWFKYVAA